jgi:protease I
VLDDWRPKESMGYIRGQSAQTRKEPNMARVALVIAPDQFRDEEYSEPKAVLESRGHETVTVSVAPGPCRGKLGMMAQADVSIRDIEATDFDAVVFVGGSGSSIFFDDTFAHELAREALWSGDVLGAICVAPSTLARAGLLQGVSATCFPSQREDLEAHGATYTGMPVETSGRIVTACGPEAATRFGEAIADVLDA